MLDETRDRTAFEVAGDPGPGFLHQLTGVIARHGGDITSVQIMDSRERIQGYLRSDVREVANGKQSAMPVFGPERLNESDLNDLLAYLATLKGFDPSVQ